MKFFDRWMKVAAFISAFFISVFFCTKTFLTLVQFFRDREFIVHRRTYFNRFLQNALIVFPWADVNIYFLAAIVIIRCFICRNWLLCFSDCIAFLFQFLAMSLSPWEQKCFVLHDCGGKSSTFQLKRCIYEQTCLVILQSALLNNSSHSGFVALEVPVFLNCNYTYTHHHKVDL